MLNVGMLGQLVASTPDRHRKQRASLGCQCDARAHRLDLDERMG